MAYGALAARHSLDPGSSSALSQRSAVVEYRKDGTVSKMRSHKGNIPILPQTKLCPHCPAKFTRTTHLNRHLRTHTGERLHRCDTCEAQFTRSDLLTRHKKTCGDPSHANRTRRRSCQACANSKVKCDLQQPCSKCQARGKECIFVIRPPKSSTTAKATATAAAVPEHSADPVDHLVSKLSTPPTSFPVISPVAARATADASVPPDHLGQSSYDWNASVADQMENRPEELSFSSDGPSPSPSEAISSTSDACPPNSHSEPVHHQINAFYSNEVFEPFFPNIIPGYNAVSVDHDNSRNQTCAPNTPLISSSAEDAFQLSSQSMGAQQRSQHPETLFYSSSSQQVFPSAEHTQRSYYTEDNYIPQHTASVDVRYQAFAEQQHYRLVDPTAYVRNRVKTASPYSASGGMWRASCEGLTKTQLHYLYPPKSAGDAFCEKPYRYPTGSPLRVGSDSTNRWSLPLDTARVAISDLSPRDAESDAQTYRSHLSEGLTDAVRWNGSNAMRRQVASTDFA